MAPDGTAAKPAAAEAGKVAVARRDAPNLVPGRRSFFTYADLGATVASDGRFRAQVTKGTGGLTRPTGWHRHLCEGQFVYMLQGWVELQFEDGRTIRLGEGDSVYIPGGVRHNEIAAAHELELLEISVPADMGTEPCDPPPGMAA